MALKKFSPVTPSLRQVVQTDRSALWKGKPVKTLTEGLSKSGGRNNKGRITTRHIGGGHARRIVLSISSVQSLMCRPRSSVSSTILIVPLTWP